MQWIEQVFRFAPDQGNGLTEAVVLLATLLAAGAFALLRSVKSTPRA